MDNRFLSIFFILCVLFSSIGMFYFGHKENKKIKEPIIFDRWRFNEDMTYREFEDVWNKNCIVKCPETICCHPPDRGPPKYFLSKDLYVFFNLKNMTNLWFISGYYHLSHYKDRYGLQIEIRTGGEVRHVKFALIVDPTPFDYALGDEFVNMFPSRRNYIKLKSSGRIEFFVFGFGECANTISVSSEVIDY